VADDLKLEIVIQALLDAKGFEEAKQNLGSLTQTANTVTPVLDKTGQATKRMGESFGGTRGPVADVTRLLLQQVGVTGAAGEAAKAAGTAMFFMEGAATASAVAMTAGVAALALLVPLIIRWARQTDETDKETKELLKTLDGSAAAFKKYGTSIKEATAQLAALGDASATAALDEERAALEELREQLRKLETAWDEANSEDQREEIDKRIARVKAEIAAKADAISQMKTLQETLDESAKHESDNTQTLQDNISQLNSELKRFAASREAADKAFQAGREGQIESRMRAIQKALQKDSEELARNERDAKKGALNDELRDLLVFGDKKEQLLEIEKKARWDNVSDSIEAADAVTNTLNTVFSKNKGVAIAGAIVDTFAAANQVLRDPSLIGTPYLRWTLAAAAIATGMANVNSIRSANPGFDDPFADLTARKLGRKSAVDFVANFGAGFHGAMGAMSGGGSVSNNTTINRGTSVGAVNIHGFMGAGKTELMKTLNRELTKVQRLERRTTLGR
jgi:uncharacterized small protein (DUF1192 family)